MIRIPVAAWQMREIKREYEQCQKEGRPFEILFNEPYISDYYGLNALNGHTVLWEVIYKYEHNDDPYRPVLKERTMFITDTKSSTYEEEIKKCEERAKEHEAKDNLKLIKMKARPLIVQTELHNLSPVLIETPEYIESHGNYKHGTPTDYNGTNFKVFVAADDEHIEMQ